MESWWPHDHHLADPELVCPGSRSAEALEVVDPWSEVHPRPRAMRRAPSPPDSPTAAASRPAQLQISDRLCNRSQPGFVVQEPAGEVSRPPRSAARGGSTAGGFGAATATRPARSISEGDWITVVTNVTGTFTGETTLPDGMAIAPTANAFHFKVRQTTV